MFVDQGKDTVELIEEEFEAENDLMLQEACNEAGIDAESLEQLAEGKTIVRFNKNARIKQLKGKAASIIAKEKGDPNFKKMMFHRRKYLAFKKKVQAKYDGVAMKRANKAFRTGKLVEPVSIR